MIRQVCVYCASSRKCREVYFEAARDLGEGLAKRSITVVYGGGAVGLMGALADGALRAGGSVVGIIPEFMKELEWQHAQVPDMRVVDSMHARKDMMIAEADAFVALPGGSGTLEELLETITWKRLGLHSAPIVIVNLDAFYDPLLEQLERCIEENLMHEQHRAMWTAVNNVTEVFTLLEDPPQWSADAGKHFAQL